MVGGGAAQYLTTALLLISRPPEHNADSCIAAYRSVLQTILILASFNKTESDELHNKRFKVEKIWSKNSLLSFKSCARIAAAVVVVGVLLFLMAPPVIK